MFRRSFLSIWAVGLVIATSCFYIVDFYESRRVYDQLDIQFHGKLKSLDQSMRSLSDLIHATQKFMANGNSPSQDQFQNFLNARTGIDSGIHSVFWLPVVNFDHLFEFQQQAQANGLLGFQLLPSVKETPSCANWLRNATLPVLFVSPQFEASDYLGQRIDADCRDALAMKQAIISQEVATSLFTQDGHQGIKLFLPVMSDSNELEGFVVASVLFHEFLGVTWKNDFNSEEMYLSVVNISERPLTDIFQSHIHQTHHKIAYYEEEITYLKDVTLPVINQTWRISVSTIDNRFSMLIYGYSAVILILLLTSSVAFGVRFYAHRLEISDKLVKEKTHSLEIQATHDILTGLLNRQALNAKIEEQLQGIQQGMTKGFSVLFIDLDRFKIINDSMGHIVGDLVLQQVSTRLKFNTYKHDTCFRFGGDEFVLCLPNQTDEQAVHNLCVRFTEILSKPYSIKGQTCHLGASIGVSVVTSSSQTLASILREADTAMYKAKKSGTEKVVFFNEKMYTQVKQQFILEQELTTAIEEEQLSLAFQPIYCTENDEVAGFEALLRWNHPEKGYIPPDEFIPLAEEIGLIIKIGDWVVREVCQTLEAIYLSQSLTDLPRININVSAKQFESNHIIHTLQSELERYNFPSHLLGIEITESLLLSNSSCTVDALNDIKKLGAIIYLDDFGTGYSSLSVLSEYPVDIVKIDRSFVSNIDNEEHKSAQLCRAIISMSHSISLAVVAEGVETQSQLTTLREFGCNYIQGYLKAKPVCKVGLRDFLNYKLGCSKDLDLDKSAYSRSNEKSLSQVS
ncbi:EAL domain-containing protein [Vibrio sp. 10N.261.55.A7]|uniref:bifunctional diguanylate cyclase/phosphodiesterase n=1 Tax=Vibrio sp. 10N.261.55.A7 TaxID=1880851 RepID=UPI001F53462E|nr:EAL domain-containing protein [Vibrio sp. 10N.261.55.A7]